MSLPSRLLGANPSIQVSTLLSGSLSTPSAKQGFINNNSFESIMTETVASNTTAITFSNIPQTYTHLQLRIFSRDTRQTDNSPIQITFNGDTTANYYRHGMYGGANSAPTCETQLGVGSIWFMGGADAGLPTTFGAAIVDILDYRNTTKKKTTLAIGGQDYNGSGWAWIWSGHWNSTSAITSMRVASYTDSSFYFVPGSKFALYGIKVA